MFDVSFFRVSLYLGMVLGLLSFISGLAHATPQIGPNALIQRAQNAARNIQRSQQSLPEEDQEKDSKKTVDLAPVLVPEEKLRTLGRGRAVFGQQIFNGQFANQNFIGFNADYEIGAGDIIAIRLWGGFDADALIPVDAQGNIFLPQIGPIKVKGVRNKDLNARITAAVKTTFTENVGVYASLEGAEPVRVFVTGFVKQPGLYAGHSSDSVLYFLDSAGGIDTEAGSFLDIEVKRNGQTLKKVNLYDFLMEGTLPLFQIIDGDTIIVNPVKSRAAVLGEVQNRFSFEFPTQDVTGDVLLALARPTAEATHVRINRNSSAMLEVSYLTLEDAKRETIFPGDVLEVISDKSTGTISVRVEGEHTSSHEFVLPYGTTLLELLQQVSFGENAQSEAIQLYRESVRIRQKEMLNAQLRALESSVLTAQSKTVEEAALRTQEAQLVLQWVERARDIEPLGQVSLGAAGPRDGILLEPGDVIKIPRKSKLVLVHGEVLFPNAMTWEQDMTVEDYIERSGGFTQSKGSANVLLLHRDGTFEKISTGRLDSTRIDIMPGDEIFILPKVSTKNFQFGKDIIQILYSLALSAGVVLRL